MANYSYLADGTKLEAVDGSGGGLVYRGPFVYRKSPGSSSLTLESVSFGGGRLAAGKALLHVRDYLGSVRAVIDGSTGAAYKASDYSTFGNESAVSSVETSAVPSGMTLRDAYTGKEDQDKDFGTSYTDFGARQYSPQLRRWMVPDPMSEKYYGTSPYAFCANNPVNFVDPDGKDWYEDDSGNAKWKKSNEDSYIDENKKEWRNIGQEYLFFDGNNLHYYIQNDGMVFDAVSGRKNNSGKFIYTKNQQSAKSEGPIPEGLYYINPQEIQSYWETNIFQKVAGLLGRGSFPNGPLAWGFERVWIKPEEVKVYNPITNEYVTRSGFSIHGGLVPGSAGCIDLSGNAQAFFKKLKNSESNYIRLNVNYGYKQ